MDTELFYEVVCLPEEAPFCVMGFGRDGEETAEDEAWDLEEAIRIGQGMYDDFRTVSYEIWDNAKDDEYSPCCRSVS